MKVNVFFLFKKNLLTYNLLSFPPTFFFSRLEPFSYYCNSLEGFNSLLFTLKNKNPVPATQNKILIFFL